MTRRQGKLKLGKGSAFVKRRLLWLPQEDLVREADFCPLTESVSGEHSLWLGLVVSHHNGSILAQEILEDPPDVNNLANLLDNAMQSPLTDENRCRPKAIHLRDNPEWEELLPHLEQLSIQVVVTEDLPAWDKTSGDLIGYLEQWRSTHASEGYIGTRVPRELHDGFSSLFVASGLRGRTNGVYSSCIWCLFVGVVAPVTWIDA